MNTLPPQGPGYYAPPPPPQNNSGGCWKAAGITCGVLLLLMIIGVVSAVKWFNSTGVMGQIQNVTNVAMQGQEIYAAVSNYKAANGKYPDNLQQLTPSYIPAAKLHSSTDPNPDTNHISWNYYKPNENSSPKSPMLVMEYEMKMNIGGKQTRQKVPIIINVDGSSPRHNQNGTYGNQYNNQ